MPLKDNILFAMNQSRRMLEGLIGSMNSVDDWVFQTHPKANHGLWIVGHLGLADNMFLTRLDESAGSKQAGWTSCFGLAQRSIPTLQNIRPRKKL